eukprot:TRINITY_DN113752_c0_g1_i1.p1 TRINITY_DN113752_c0_g1~~TRINITY_DN113752_c0_g1_i1.p1  ORF type:complete len:103 (+),score=5.94 TRINITY_DN113752_c0_g1_i1:189-497(+)
MLASLQSCCCVQLPAEPIRHQWQVCCRKLALSSMQNYPKPFFSRVCMEDIRDDTRGIKTTGTTATKSTAAAHRKINSYTSYTCIVFSHCLRCPYWESEDSCM